MAEEHFSALKIRETLLAMGLSVHVEAGSDLVVFKENTVPPHYPAFDLSQPMTKEEIERQLEYEGINVAQFWQEWESIG